MNNRITRRQLLQTSGSGAVAALLAACGRGGSLLLAPSGAVLTTELERPPRRRPPLAAPLRASLPVPAVPLAEKIGQMIMLGFRGRTVTPDSMIIRAVRDLHVGGVVYFRYNVQTPSQLTALSAGLQAAAARPLLIAIDHEGGLVNRFAGDFGFASNYSAQDLGTRNDLVTTRQQSENVAERLATFGINLNLAPVVDLNLNPGNPVIGGVWRSYSADPEVVTAQARAVIEAHHDHNVLCTLKHFPGHGNSRSDSHLGFVDVTETWRAEELLPYANLIHQGLADAIMTAHIYNAQLDAIYPATLSGPIISGILRNRLGYDGVVISDDMQMRAISKHFDFETAVGLAVIAGVDMLAISNNLAYADDWPERTVRAIQKLVEDGKVSAERIDQSYQRIQRLKQKLAAPADAG